MDRKSPVLEYRVTHPEGAGNPQWGFRFSDPDGRTLVESARVFESLAQAEEAFVGMIRVIATNRYRIDTPSS